LVWWQDRLVLAGLQLPPLLLLVLCPVLCWDPCSWQLGALLLCWVVLPCQQCQSCWLMECCRPCWLLPLALQELLLQPALQQQ
jgi:hypothetical protein